MEYRNFIPTWDETLGLHKKALVDFPPTNAYGNDYSSNLFVQHPRNLHNLRG